MSGAGRLTAVGLTAVAVVLSLVAPVGSAAAAARSTATEATSAATPTRPAKPVRLPTTIVVGPTTVQDDPLFSLEARGRLKARKPMCRKARRVRVHMVTDDGRRFLDRHRTQRDGSWRLRISALLTMDTDQVRWLEISTFRKVVKRKKRRNVVCRAARVRWAPTIGRWMNVMVGYPGPALEAAGDVEFINPRCSTGRRVIVRNVTTGRRVGSGAVTPPTPGTYGSWIMEIAADGNSLDHHYRARVPRKTVHIRGKRVLCGVGIMND